MPGQERAPGSDCVPTGPRGPPGAASGEPSPRGREGPAAVPAARRRGTLTHSGRGPLLGAHEPPHGVVAGVAVLPVEAVPPSWRGEQGSAAPAPPRAGGLGSGRRLGEGGRRRAAPCPAPARAARGSPSRNSSQRRLPLDSLR